MRLYSWVTQCEEIGRQLGNDNGASYRYFEPMRPGLSSRRPLLGVVSTDRRNTGFKFLCWGLVLQGFSRSLVKLASDGAEFGLAKA